MQRRTKVLLAGIAVVGSVAAGTSIAIAGSSDDDGTEVPITGGDLERASAAALAHTGEGRVSGTEAGDEESAYEVEVTLDDGSQVDVQLDESFAVVSTEPESGGEADEADEG